jgi:hypothetical protein
VARDDQKSPEAHLAMKQRMGGGRTAITSLTVQSKVWTDQTARTWPTPRASFNENRTQANAPSHGNGHGETLAGVANGLLLATMPTDGDAGQPAADLNPRFVEALMGIPQGWLTPCTSVGTVSYRAWLHAHSLSSRPGLG